MGVCVCGRVCGRNWFIMGVCDVQMRVGVLWVYVCVCVRMCERVFLCVRVMCECACMFERLSACMRATVDMPDSLSHLHNAVIAN